MSIYTYKTSGDGSWALDTSAVTFNGSGFSGQISMNTKQFCEQPDSICKNSFNWSWRVLYVDEELLGPPYEIGTSSHTYYKVLATPQAPMNYSWVEVLDYSCEWAEGETTLVGTATKIAEGIYDTDDPDWNVLYQQNGKYSPTHFSFKLESFLSDIIDEEVDVRINCSDVANLFNILSTAVGCESESRVYRQNPAPPYMLTKTIRLIGEAADRDSVPWGYHQYGWLGSKVYDACLKLNYGGMIIPTNMEENTYIDSLIAVQIEENIVKTTGTVSIVSE